MPASHHRIYQYRPDRVGRDLETLLAGQVWSSTVEALNDPFEFSGLRANADAQAEFQAAGVTCFCRALTNPLLWAHYAASHIGFAVGYDPAHPFFGGDKGIGGRFLLDVRYEDVMPSLETHSPQALRIAAVTTKPTCWAYEQEVRLVKQQGGVSADVPRDAIQEILLGARMAPARVDTIIHAVRAAGITARFAKMEFISEGYGVKPKWIDG